MSVQVDRMMQKIDEPCRIVPMENLGGRVLGVYVDSGGAEYDVRYYLDGEVKRENFRENEVAFK